AEKQRKAALLRRAANDLALEGAAKLRAKADAAVLKEIAEHAVKVMLEGSGLRVTVNLSSPEPTVRLTARHAVALTLARLQRHEEARQGDARSRVLAAGTGNQAATPEELASFLADEIRASIKHGSA